MTDKPPRLPNCGNTCYFNAALQFLLASPRLAKALQSDASDGPLWIALDRMITSQNNYNLSRLLHYFRGAVPEFNSDQQQDSLIALHALLDKVREPFQNLKLYREFNFSDVQLQYPAFSVYCGQRDASKTAQCVGFFVHDATQCPQCGKVTHSITQQEALILDLQELHNAATKAQYFKGFFAKRKLALQQLVDAQFTAHQEQRPCECGSDQKTLTRALLSVPELLIFIVKKAPTVALALTEQVALSCNGEPQQFRATAFVVHHTFPVNHYTALVRRGAAWFNCDDDTISAVPFKDGVQAYYCGYERVQ